MGANHSTVSWRFRQASQRLDHTPEQAFDALNRQTDGRASSQMLAELVTKMGEMGYFGITIPEDLGGAGLGSFEYCLVAEEL